MEYNLIIGVKYEEDGERKETLKKSEFPRINLPIAYQPKLTDKKAIVLISPQIGVKSSELLTYNLTACWKKGPSPFSSFLFGFKFRCK